MAKSLFFEKFVALFGKKISLSELKNFVKDYFCQNWFPSILRLKKVPFATKLEEGGGGKVLMAGPLKKNNSFAASLSE